MRKKRALVSIIFSLLLEIVTVISGFIVPRLIISTYGSSVNGLVNSITSFIGYISILQLGVGSVVKASLYKPLAKRDQAALNTIVKTTLGFFRKIGIVTIIYIGILTFVFPAFLATEFDFLYTAILVAIIGIGTIFTYLYGITYQMLLEADQRSYIFSAVQIITVILNTIAVVILVRVGASIHLVKAASAVFYVIRPMAIAAYVRKKYKLDLKVPSDPAVISQRWDGFAQGLAYYIHSKTDIFVLTIFSSMVNVSIYSIYALVTTGLNSLTTSIDKAVRSAFGNILASEESEHLKKTFDAYNTCFHMLSTVMFATASVTVFNFISVYVGNVSDAEYIQPMFGILIITAEYLYCLRMPYNSIIFAAGKFKETKNSAFIEAGINIIISCILVYSLGLIGVAIGTLIAMVYRTVSFAVYLHNNILKLPYIQQIKRYSITSLTYILCVIGLSNIKMQINGYFSWGIYAAIICVLSSVVVLMINVIFDGKHTIGAIRAFIGNRKNKK